MRAPDSGIGAQFAIRAGNSIPETRYAFRNGCGWHWCRGLSEDAVALQSDAHPEGTSTPPTDASVRDRSIRGRRRDSSVQTMRGIAVILMVSGHVIGGLPGTGLRVEADSLWRYEYLALADIRMPLFTMLSGYVYAMRPVEQIGDYPQLLRAKSRRLLLPLLTIGTLQYCLQSIVPGTNTRPDEAFWRIYLFGFDHLWFLQSIFLIFLIVGMLDGLGMLSMKPAWLLAFAVASAAWIAISVPPNVNVFSLSGALRLLPYFLIGYALRRFAFHGINRWSVFFLIALFSTAYPVRLLTILGRYEPSLQVNRVVALAVGSSAVALLFSVRHLLDNRFLAWIGQFSFGIYLLHVLATSGSRIILEHLGVHFRAGLFVVGLTVGIMAPIAFQLLFRRSKFVQTCMLGERHAGRGADV